MNKKMAKNIKTKREAKKTLMKFKSLEVDRVISSDKLVIISPLTFLLKKSLSTEKSLAQTAFLILFS